MRRDGTIRRIRPEQNPIDAAARRRRFGVPRPRRQRFSRRRHRRLGGRARGVHPAPRRFPPTPAWPSSSSSTCPHAHQLPARGAGQGHRDAGQPGRGRDARGAEPRLRHPARRGHGDRRASCCACAARARRAHGPTCRSISSCAPSPRRAAATRSASSSRGPPRTAPTGCGPSRRRTASRLRRIRVGEVRRMPRSAVDAGVVDFAWRSPSSAEELVRLSRHPYVAAGQRAGHRPATTRR